MPPWTHEQADGVVSRWGGDLPNLSNVVNSAEGSQFTAVECTDEVTLAGADDSAPSATRPEPTHDSRKVLQIVETIFHLAENNPRFVREPNKAGLELGDVT